MSLKKKVMHINLHGTQVDDYELMRFETGITNDNDLVRHLFRKAANEARQARQRLGLEPTPLQPVMEA